MRSISEEKISNAIRKLVVKAAIDLRPDVRRALQKAISTEKNMKSRQILSVLIENAAIAKKKKLPLCQDTGMTVVFCEIGQNVNIAGNLERAINKGLIEGSKEGCLRRSIVKDPLKRSNTNTNGPAVVHMHLRNGDKLKLSILLKGFGCENKGQTVMLNPTASAEDIKKEVVRIVSEAGPDACPPYIVGVGIGGTLDKAAAMSKEVLFTAIGVRNNMSSWARLERQILRECNTLPIGPLGLGGTTTVLDVKIKTFPTHIAGLPIAVNISCHALRSASIII